MIFASPAGSFGCKGTDPIGKFHRYGIFIWSLRCSNSISSCPFSPGILSLSLSFSAVEILERRKASDGCLNQNAIAVVYTTNLIIFFNFKTMTDVLMYPTVVIPFVCIFNIRYH